jgi:hypothetical protein
MRCHTPWNLNHLIESHRKRVVHSDRVAWQSDRYFTTTRKKGPGESPALFVSDCPFFYGKRTFATGSTITFKLAPFAMSVAFGVGGVDTPRIAQKLLLASITLPF